MGYLISETTKEEREKIVAESLGNIEANCDGCMAGLAEMYQDYIDGKNGIKEAYRDITGKVTTEDIEAEQICNEEEK